ncbi:peptide ABC transporter substrate-binding protein [Virgibacillus sp. MSJ-26]|uniref:peptide ABC transporter substrate-binding protein n=1 Tax=Virgibacillus sp. MSJ-26 TaxID=2841522 RepID=UPI001C0F622B|nr:peptide ABC transporter substrate-binding protein [Virgibacillus sp. MSJ-26]MBU5467190.1 peptide ABC transporter substrate-binding protein [Virgibacillus sp. MSJ-26]
MKYIRSFLLILIVFTLVLGACGKSEEQDISSEETDEQEEKVVHLSAPGEIPSLDPTLADNDFSFNVINQVFEGLYRLDKDGEPQLAMAASEPDVSDDGRVYTFTLRDDVTWSDGSSVTAHDFEYSWKKAVDPETTAAYGPQFEEIVEGATDILVGDKPSDELGVNALDDKTLEVTLEAPVPYFKDLLTTAVFFPQPKEYVEEQGKDYALDSDHALYNGPFILTDWNGTGDTWTYEKNDQYWDKESVNVDRIQVNVVKDTQTAIDLYENDQLDRVVLSGDFVDEYQTDDEYHTYLTGGVRFLKMNQGKDDEETELANLNIRQALNMALDRDAIVDHLLNNGSTPLYATVAEGLANNPDTDEDFRSENGDLTYYDEGEARDKWEKGLKELDINELELELTTSDSSSTKVLAENLKNQWESALPGLTIIVKNVPPKQSVEANVTQNFDLILTGWGGDYQDPMTYLNLFITDSPGNHTGFSNDKYDELVLKSKSSLAGKPKERWDSLLEAERILIEDNAVLIPISQNGTAYLEKDKIKNFITYKVSADNYKWIDVEA